MRFRFRPKFKSRKKRLGHVAVLPTLMTLGNALCGFGAIACVAEGPHLFERAAWLILLAMVFDALDGRLARMTGSASNFGAQLDSLSDMVTFGVAPVVLVMQVMTNPLPVLQTKLVWLICALYVACTALRLARFNVETTPDEAAHDHFRGLPSPGAAGLLASVILLHADLLTNSATGKFDPACFQDGVIPKLLPFITIIASLLMISPIRYVHVINRVVRQGHPFTTVVEIILVAVLVAFKPELAILIGFAVYVTLGPIDYVRFRFSPQYREQMARRAEKSEEVVE